MSAQISHLQNWHDTHCFCKVLWIWSWSWWLGKRLWIFKPLARLLASVFFWLHFWVKETGRVKCPLVCPWLMGEGIVNQMLSTVTWISSQGFMDVATALAWLIIAHHRRHELNIWHPCTHLPAAAHHTVFSFRGGEENAESSCRMNTGGHWSF